MTSQCESEAPLPGLYVLRTWGFDRFLHRLFNYHFARSSSLLLSFLGLHRGFFFSLKVSESTRITDLDKQSLNSKYIKYNMLELKTDLISIPIFIFHARNQ